MQLYNKWPQRRLAAYVVTLPAGKGKGNYTVSQKKPDPCYLLQ